jgi:hypothetical protein
MTSSGHSHSYPSLNCLCVVTHMAGELLSHVRQSFAQQVAVEVCTNNTKTPHGLALRLHFKEQHLD